MTLQRPTALCRAAHGIHVSGGEIDAHCVAHGRNALKGTEAQCPVAQSGTDSNDNVPLFIRVGSNPLQRLGILQIEVDFTVELLHLGEDAQ